MQALFKIVASGIAEARCPSVQHRRRRRNCNSSERATSIVIDEPVVTITAAPSPSHGRSDRSVYGPPEGDEFVESLGVLYNLARSWAWAALAHRCTTNPTEVSVDLVNKDGDTALHWTVFGNPPLYAVEALLGACPDLVNVKNAAGNLPLHVACSYRASACVLRSLIAANPTTASSPNGRGFTPLHMLCDFDCRLPSIQALLESAEGARTVANTDRIYGRKALHILNERKNLHRFTDQVSKLREARRRARYAVLYGNWTESDQRRLERKMVDAKQLEFWSKARVLILAEYHQRPLTNDDYGDENMDTIKACIAMEDCLPSLLEYAVLVYRDELRIFDEFGNLPLHQACARRGEVAKEKQWIVLECITAFPEAAKKANKDGHLPLEIFLRSFDESPGWSEALKRLVFAHPAALEALDIDSRMYPMILMKMGCDRKGHSEIYGLMRGNPALFVT